MKTSVQEVLKNTNLSQNKPLNEIVYESFKTTIIQGKIPAGERINEKEYSDTMNISRTPIRYALRLLENEGLVEYIPKVGVVVKQVTIKDAYEIYEIRKSLEALAIVAAMYKMTDEDFKDLDDLLSLTEKANKNGNIEEVIRLFVAYHNFMYDKSEMIRVKEVITKVREYLNRFRDMSLTAAARRNKAIMEHRLIYEAMIDQDELRVKAIVEEHLNYSLKFILEEMKREELEKACLTKNKRLKQWLEEV